MSVKSLPLVESLNECPICGIKHKFRQGVECYYVVKTPLFAHLKSEWQEFNRQLWARQVESNFRHI
jgi:hypothetical protein